MRVQTDPRYGQLPCGGCSEKQKNEFRCVLKGHERLPSKAPNQYRVQMGPNKRPEFFRSCPVGSTLTDDIIPFFVAYNTHKAFGEWPPGRRNPRVLEAFMVIEREFNDVQRESPKDTPK